MVATILRHNVSTVVQNVALLRVMSFYADITTHLKKVRDQVGHQKMGINIGIVCRMLSSHQMQLNCTHWAFKALHYIILYYIIFARPERTGFNFKN